MISVLVVSNLHVTVPPPFFEVVGRKEYQLMPQILAVRVAFFSLSICICILKYVAIWQQVFIVRHTRGREVVIWIFANKPLHIRPLDQLLAASSKWRWKRVKYEQQDAEKLTLSTITIGFRLRTRGFNVLLNTDIFRLFDFCGDPVRNRRAWSANMMRWDGSKVKV